MQPATVEAPLGWIDSFEGKTHKKAWRVALLLPFFFPFLKTVWKEKNQRSFGKKEHPNHYLKSFLLIFFVILGEGAHRDRSHVFIEFFREI